MTLSVNIWVAVDHTTVARDGSAVTALVGDCYKWLFISTGSGYLLALAHSDRSVLIPMDSSAPSEADLGSFWDARSVSVVGSFVILCAVSYVAPLPNAGAYGSVRSDMKTQTGNDGENTERPRQRQALPTCGVLREPHCMLCVGHGRLPFQRKFW